MGETLTVQAVAELVGGRYEGDAAVSVRAMASIDEAGSGDITFAADQKWVSRLAGCKASVAIVDLTAQVPPGMTVIRVANVQQAVAKLLGHWASQEPVAPGIDPTARIAADAHVADTVSIGPGVTIGPAAEIGARTVLRAHVSIGRGTRIGADCMLAEGVVVCHQCAIGDRVVIGPNSVIGWEGFGYYFADGKQNKVPHAGNVVIDDDVEIGACACVDRAKFGSTRIGAGTKIDNLVQVAHNVRIGRGCIIAGLAGIAGSTCLGDGCIIMGHVGIRDNITVGDGVRCAGYAAIMSDVEPGQTVAGIPARNAGEALRIVQAWPKLPELLKRVRKLESRISSLESSKDH